MRNLLDGNGSIPIQLEHRNQAPDILMDVFQGIFRIIVHLGQLVWFLFRHFVYPIVKMILVFFWYILKSIYFALANLVSEFHISLKERPASGQHQVDVNQVWGRQHQYQ